MKDQNLTTALMRLEHCYLSTLEIKGETPQLNIALSGEPCHANATKDPVCEVDYNFKRHIKGPRFWVTYSVGLSWPEEETAPYESIRLTLEGVYSFPDDTDDETIARYVPVLCLTGLHGVARGILMQSTGSCPAGPVLLPLIDMNQVVQARIEQTDKE